MCEPASMQRVCQDTGDSRSGAAGSAWTMTSLRMPRIELLRGEDYSYMHVYTLLLRDCEQRMQRVGPGSPMKPTPPVTKMLRPLTAPITYIFLDVRMPVECQQGGRYQASVRRKEQGVMSGVQIATRLLFGLRPRATLKCEGQTRCS